MGRDGLYFEMRKKSDFWILPGGVLWVRYVFNVLTGSTAKTFMVDGRSVVRHDSHKKRVHTARHIQIASHPDQPGTEGSLSVIRLRVSSFWVRGVFPLIP